MLSVIMLNFIMFSVVAPSFKDIYNQNFRKNIVLSKKKTNISKKRFFKAENFGATTFSMTTFSTQCHYKKCWNYKSLYDICCNAEMLSETMVSVNLVCAIRTVSLC